MSKRLTFYSLKRPEFRQFSGNTLDCSTGHVSEVQKVRSLPINRVKPPRLSALETFLPQEVTKMANEDAPGNWPYYLVGSTDRAADDAGWTEVVIPRGLPVLGNLYGCLTATIIYSSSDCMSQAPKNGFDRNNFACVCPQENCTIRSTAFSEMSKISCPTNNEVT